jgi:hypothetical protein
MLKPWIKGVVFFVWLYSGLSYREDKGSKICLEKD